MRTAGSQVGEAQELASGYLGMKEWDYGDFLGFRVGMKEWKRKWNYREYGNYIGFRVGTKE